MFKKNNKKKKIKYVNGAYNLIVCNGIATVYNQDSTWMKNVCKL